MVVAFSRTLEAAPDLKQYYDLGIDLLLAGVEGVAARNG
jgi:hypothetical protein